MQTPSNLPKLMDAVDAMLIINEQKMNSITGGFGGGLGIPGL